MKVGVATNESLDKDEIIIQCHEVDDKIKKIKNYAQNIDLVLMAKEEQETVLLSPEDIYYVESVEKKTFVYLENRVLESKLRLYEIETMFQGLSFFRASKNCIVNVTYIKRISLMINRNLMLTLNNQEKLVLSRRNVKEFNKFIGME
ncbi:LytTR family DNA-binding domain-containing protein [Anaeromicropila herbilytica]|uniref:LytTR family transcriptional regulator n=1 Tax=Anaeromicropila herbilytica TaxID=2785025 RepID=A0A7R7IEF4_9FIRM|nr:LytTR family DNA-binding domain-containing protein [Anaeromicropila herbilytica]BCN32587.1 LytTR family transcriptional regulator [Anaeromicropila herbilytica]